MTGQQLELFSDGLVELPAVEPPSGDSAAASPPRALPTPVEQGGTPRDEERTLLPVAPALAELDSATTVEPYRFSLTDPTGLWTITAGHEDEVRRGKTTRQMVGRCSCGWVLAFQLRPYGGTGPDRLVAHLRAHQLDGMPPVWRVEAVQGGWRTVRLLAGRTHCESSECHRLGPLPGKQRVAGSQAHRRSAGFGEPCHGHGGVLYDRAYHWEEHDPEDHTGEPKRSLAVGLLDPEGTFWHYWCAPLDGRRLFGFLREEEGPDAVDDLVSSSAPHLS